MILELILLPFWLLIDLIITLFPDFAGIAFDFLGSLSFLKIGLYFLPSGFWLSFIGSVLFWLSANFAWAIIEWVYKKIPGVE